MKESVYTPVIMIIVVCLVNLVINSYYGRKKREIIARFRQVDSVEIKNISGYIAGGLSIQWFRFDVMINADTIFLFPYVAIGRLVILNQPVINLRFVPGINPATSVERKNGLRWEAGGKLKITYAPESPFIEEYTITLKRLEPMQVNALQLFWDNNNDDQRVLKETYQYIKTLMQQPTHLVK